MCFATDFIWDFIGFHGFHLFYTYPLPNGKHRVCGPLATKRHALIHVTGDRNSKTCYVFWCVQEIILLCTHWAREVLIRFVP